jgi:hypothetical protein
VVPQRSAAKARAVGESDADQAIGRLVKYIPGEVISGYMLFSGLVAGAAQTSPLRPFAGWLIFALGLAFTPLYLWKLGRPTGVQWWQLPISTLSFALWAYALGGPFLTVNIFGFAYESWFAALLAGLFSWGIALVWKPTD